MSNAKIAVRYPNSMLESIKIVETTRDRRLNETFPLMNLEEREEILKKFHPDYKKDAKRPVKIGPNKGDLMPHEVADLLEAHPMVKPDDIDLAKTDFEVDILIIGGGGAGMTAALWANYNGIEAENILIVQKLRLGDSNSIMSQGGVQAADRSNDTPTLHYLDVLGGGHFTNDRKLAKRLVLDAPQIMKWHEELGVMYDKESDGTMVEIHGGGTCRKRMHSARDYTGLEIIRNLKDEIINKEIHVLEFVSVIELLLDKERQVVGAILLNMETKEYYIVKAKKTILTTGGFGRLHIQGFPTTNHYGATADGIVLAYRVGAKLRDLDAVQYHPTGAAYPEQIVGLLVTEKVRGLGAQPINKRGEQFVYPREPRDVEASAIIRECYERNNGIKTPTGMSGVWLDTPMIDTLHGEGTTEKKLPAMRRQYMRFGIDITQDPILVFPTLHFQNGGVIINENAETTVKGLFAAGEITGGTHGKNRLMGNSILDYSVFGRIAGINAARSAKKANIGTPTLHHLVDYEKMIENAGIETDRKAPLLLPEYRGEEVLAHKLEIM
jgi:succinate dehydrogenase / fumarate reductase flavoprotein subunit